MLKETGIIFIGLSCAAMGWSKGAELSKRLCQLKEIEKILYFLLGEITYRREALPEALTRIAKKTEEPFDDFLQEVSQHANLFQGKEFSSIFREKTEEYLKKSSLTERQIREFGEIGEYLGWLDVDLQNKTITMYLEQLKEEIRMLSEELPARKKMYRSLGTLAGAFLAVLLI